MHIKILTQSLPNKSWKMDKHTLNMLRQIKRGYIDSLDFNVDNQKIKWQIQEQNIDIATIYLNQSLKAEIQ